MQEENANQQKQAGSGNAQRRYHLHQGAGEGERGEHQHHQPEQQRRLCEAADPGPDRPCAGRRPSGDYRGKELEHEIPSRDLGLPGEDLCHVASGTAGGVGQKGVVDHASHYQGPPAAIDGPAGGGADTAGPGYGVQAVPPGRFPSYPNRQDRPHQPRGPAGLAQQKQRRDFIMMTYQTIHLRRFTVQIRDERTGETRQDAIVLSKEQLQAAQLCGQSSKELIYRRFNRAGFTVLDIGKAEKRTIQLDLESVFIEAVLD